MTDQELLERGYTKYPPWRPNKEFCECLFQKRFDDERGKKYFINVDKWDFRSAGGNISYEGNVQMSTRDDDLTLTMTFHDWPIEKIEEFTEWLWQQKFDYYERI